MTNAAPGPGQLAPVQLETRASTDLAGEPLQEKFVAMNNVVNGVFFDLVEDASSSWSRFGGPKE